MMVWSINLFVLSIGIFIVGMLKPNWIFFWMEKPGRFPIAVFCATIFMIAATMFGQANIEKKRELTEQTQQTSQTKEDTIPAIKTEEVKQINEVIEAK